MGLWLTLRGVSASSLLRVLSITDVRAVAALSLPLLLAGSLLRTARFGALLGKSEPRPRFVDLWSGIILGGAANNVLPLRAGELVRTRETVAAGVPLPRAAVAQVSEKVVEGVLIVAWSAPALAARIGSGASAAALITGALVGVPVAAWCLRGHPTGTRRLATCLAWCVAADAVEIAIISVCLAGLGLPGGLLPSVTVFAAVNVAIAVPSTPANLGAFEAGSALPLIALGVAPDAAVGFAVVYRVVQWLPVTLAGAVLWARRMTLAPGGRIGAGGPGARVAGGCWRCRVPCTSRAAPDRPRSS